MGYLQKENNNVIELYNMFSRYRWQTYIFYRSADVAPMMATAAMATAAMATAAMATAAMARARVIPATCTARAPAEGHAPHSWDRDHGCGDEGGDRGARGREDRGMDRGSGRRDHGGGGGGSGHVAPRPPPPPRRNPPRGPPRGGHIPYLLKN